VEAKKGDQPIAPTNPIPFCELCTAIAENLRDLRKFAGSRSPSDSDIPRAKVAKVAKLEIYFFSSFALFACFARDNPSFGCGFAAL